MDGSRFDALARTLHEVRSRRGAFAPLLGGALGLLGLAETTAKKKKKKKKKPSASPLAPPPVLPTPCIASCADKACGAADGCGGVCQSGSCVSGASCVSGQCVGVCDGFAAGDPCPYNSLDFCCTSNLCCLKGEACLGDGSCQSCPAVPDPCKSIPLCGYFGPSEEDQCGCLTSVEGVPTCSSFFGSCANCTTDQECAEIMRVPAICMNFPCLPGCESTGGKVCMVDGCKDYSNSAASAAAVQSEGVGGLKRLSGLRPAS